MTRQDLHKADIIKQHDPTILFQFVQELLIQYAHYVYALLHMLYLMIRVPKYSSRKNAEEKE